MTTKNNINVQSPKKDLAIQLIRVVAMMMVVIGHIIDNINIPAKSVLAQVSNTGVFIFVFISGVLFGRNKITQWGRWFKKRFIRIFIPLWIFVIIDSIVEYCLWGIYFPKGIIMAMFNLQGFYVRYFGMVSLWFITLIMICYIITPLLQLIKNKTENTKSRACVFYVAIAIMFVIQVVLAYTVNYGMTGGHTYSWCMLALIAYCLGYFAGDIVLPTENSNKALRTAFSTIAMMVAVTVVFVAHSKFDGQIIYDRIITYYGMIIIDWWICTILYYFANMIKEKAFWSLIGFLDEISYEFYIVHGILIVAVIIPVANNVFGFFASAILISIVAAKILSLLAGLVKKLIKT